MKKLLLLLTIGILSTNIIAQEAGSITSEVMDKLKQSVWDDEDDRALINAVTHNDIKKLALNRANEGKVNHYFSHKVKTAGISDQKSSGRCWLFTGLNIMKPLVLEKYNLKEFEFSQTYNFFFDQLEKSNLFLEGIIATRNKTENDRSVEWFFKHTLSDGGQWTTFSDIVTKYGLVPKSAMPETYQSEKTSMMHRLIARKLREDALKIRNMAADGKKLEEIREEKVDMLAEIYRILALSLGHPPQEFTWQYKDKDGNISEELTFTPKEFYKQAIGWDLSEFVMFMNDPSREYEKLYEIEYDRNMLEGYNWKYINLENDRIKEFAKKSIMNNQGMYFSCDVGKQLEKDAGLLDPNNYDYHDLMGVQFGIDKAGRIKTFESASTHGMALIGVNINGEGAIDKWLLENSWGEEAGNKGYLTMTDNWFDEYMFRIIIHKKYIDDETLQILETEAVKLPPWDPMFAPEQ
ncbi:MAG: C1 family peptidase [Bacteroidales bacterium]|nr:C1 family peptidase [Bacteroidales bacterium]MCF8388429.1 C1 family peptidase [Bacteroidales bacterium]MCF8396954.1 C1 family peptidase [Bacteroidales bacterium]